MTERDWTLVLQVFRACQSRRGDKGRDDRLFLEAMHFFAVENVAWRRLPERFGNWNSVWKRFSRLSESGVFEAFFEALAALSPSAHLVQMFDSTVVRAHVSAAGAKGGKTVKRSAVRGVDSRPRSTSRVISTDSRSPSISPAAKRATVAAMTDKGYDARSNRKAARDRGICPVIPYRATTRCEKTAKNYRSLIAWACGLILIKSVHTA